MDVSGNAWLKTGSLDNVQAYAGYVLTETKRWISFAILVNHRFAERAKLPLDKFIDSLYRDSSTASRRRKISNKMKKKEIFLV